MIRRKTSLLLGAGASMDFGYPGGKELYENICEITEEKNSKQYLYIKSITKSSEKINTFRTELIQSGRNSIDEFLQFRNEFAYIGKLSIASALIPLEIEDNLFIKNKSNQNWYKLLFNKMAAACKNANDFKENRIKFITFNYDRSLEHFLFKSIKNSFGTSTEEAISVVNSFDIIHLHGILGNPACLNESIQIEIEQDVYDKSNGVLYGDNYYRDYIPLLNEAILKKSVKGLKIIHDEQNEELFTKAKELLIDSEMIYILGFGFHKISLDRLGISKLPTRINIFGTVYGMKKMEINQIKIDTRDRLRDHNLVNCTIEDFFREHLPLR